MKSSTLLICDICKFIKLPEIQHICCEPGQHSLHSLQWLVAQLHSRTHSSIMGWPTCLQSVCLALPPSFCQTYACRCVSFVQHSGENTGHSREIVYLEHYLRNLDACPCWNLCELYLCSCCKYLQLGGKTERWEELTTVTFNHFPQTVRRQSDWGSYSTRAG